MLFFVFLLNIETRVFCSLKCVFLEFPSYTCMWFDIFMGVASRSGLISGMYFHGFPCRCGCFLCLAPHHPSPHAIVSCETLLCANFCQADSSNIFLRGILCRFRFSFELLDARLSFFGFRFSWFLLMHIADAGEIHGLWLLSPFTSY